MVSHALARDRPQGVEGTREFCERLSPSPPRSLDTFVAAEGNMVVQFGNRELDYPGGSFLDFEVPAGRAVRDVAFAYRLVEGRIAERWAIRDHLSMLRQLGGVPNWPPGCRSDRAVLA